MCGPQTPRDGTRNGSAGWTRGCAPPMRGARRTRGRLPPCASPDVAREGAADQRGRVADDQARGAQCDDRRHGDDGRFAGHGFSPMVSMRSSASAHRSPPRVPAFACLEPFTTGSSPVYRPGLPICRAIAADQSTAGRVRAQGPPGGGTIVQHSWTTVGPRLGLLRRPVLTLRVLRNAIARHRRLR